MKKINCLYVLAAALLLCGTAAAQHGHGVMAADKPAVHGMLIFGTQQLYAMHLPLFHAPHHYQAVLELEADKKGRQLLAKEQQQQHPHMTTWTIAPQLFVLPGMVGSRGSFSAQLYRGHFERGGTPVGDSIRFRIKSVVCFDTLGRAAARSAEAEFLLFGNKAEQFAIHRLSHTPDFDQVLQVKALLPPQPFARVVLGSTNSPAGVSGNAVTVQINGRSQTITLLRQLYLEFDDLVQ